MRALATALIISLAVIGLIACSPVVIERGAPLAAPEFTGTAIIAEDGTRLPLRHWPNTGKPRAVVLALHGFNDYSQFFDDSAEALAAFGVTSYAYDQRGFGETAGRGYWHGAETLARDAALAVRLLRGRHPDLPLYLLGESMGGAVAIIAMTEPDAPEIDGMILTAPAVWGRETMPWYQTSALWLASRTVPWMTLSGRGLKIQPSDNYAMLRRLSKDPLVIKETRVDAIHGLVDLMGLALTRSAKLQARALVLYGDRDEVVPDRPTHIMVERLPQSAAARHRIGFYQTGYHMLLRDLSAPTVHRDILTWINDQGAPLPSGADRWAAIKLGREPPLGDQAAEAAALRANGQRTAQKTAR